MPDSPSSGKLEEVLYYMKGNALKVNVCEKIQQALETEDDVKAPMIEDLLQVCIPNLQNETKYTVNTLNIISTILKKVKSEHYSPMPDLLPSAVAILNAIKTTAYFSKEGALKVLCFETLLFYPDEVYLLMTDNHLDELLDVFNLYCHQRIPAELRVQPINILNKLLKVLPPDKKTKLLEQGINLWFTKVIPAIMSLSTTPNFKTQTYLETLEMLTNEIVHIDYMDNPNWLTILECIYTPDKYPAAMKSLLERGSDIWHRLWIVYIKLLKSQITKNTSSVGSPINSLLPVVELAFKMDVANRCRAFQCWNVLIDNFSIETNVFYLNKRIKLLLIPLCSNNAKAEETVLAKLETWWHLILKFHKKLSKLPETLLIPLLHFCFGKTNICNKPALVPGLISDKTKKHCIEVFVNILGHRNCPGCVSLTKLETNVVNTGNLVENWKDWINSLRVTIKIYANIFKYTDDLRAPLKCAWISFVQVISDLPENNVRRDLFDELLTMVLNLTKECQAEKLADIILSDLIPSLVNVNDSIKSLLTSKDERTSPLHKIFLIVLNPSFDRIYDRYNLNKAVSKLMTFANYIVDQSVHAPNHIIEHLLKDLSPKYNSLVLWTALTASICEKNYDTCARTLCRMLMWPLKQMDLFTNVEVSTSQWLTLYSFVNEKYSTLPINENIWKALFEYENINPTNSSFLLNISIMLLKNNLTTDNVVNYQKEVQLLYHITSKIHGINHTDPTLLTLMDILPEIFKKLSDDVDLTMANQVLSIVKILFTHLLPEFKKPLPIDSTLVLKVELLLKAIETLLKIEAYSSLKQTISNELIDCAPYFGQEQSLKVSVLGTLQILLTGMSDSNVSVSVIKNVSELIKQGSKPTEQDTFTTPGKLSAKKTKRKETSIVDTVVENGEEFVVVKSNWKFNPKKLTDNQKEKFQRKREDIPALYQDLSQSQDEFKLNTWKTDSQDTTNSTSNSKSNCEAKSVEVSALLSNIQSTNIVPKIIKNICDNHDGDNSKTLPSNENIINPQTPLRKDTKSPRVAFKDRVFRNARNLIEKSSVQSDGKDVKVNEAMTPKATKIQNINTVINSAPTDISSDRPSRVKRKPKKFDDLQLFSLKKRRHSFGNTDSQNVESSDNTSNDSSDVPEKRCSQEEKPLTPPLTSVSDQKDQPDIDIYDLETEPPFDCNNHFENNATDQDQQMDNSNNNPKETIEEKNVENNMDANTEETTICTSQLTTDECIKNNNKQLNGTKEVLDTRSSAKKPGKKKSRIEKELAIDMVEGHPFLKAQSETRLTRKRTCHSPITPGRASLTQKLNKSRTEQKATPKADKKSKDKEIVSENKIQDKDNFENSEDGSASQDIIESSQDSTVSILSVKSTINSKRIPIVTLNSIAIPTNSSNADQITDNCNKADNSVKIETLSSTIHDNNDDTEISRNKTAIDEVQIDLTDIADTEPVGNMNTEDVIIINDDEEPPVVSNTDSSLVAPDTQNTAEADTQAFEPENVTMEKEANDTATMETQSIEVAKIGEDLTEVTSNNDECSVIRTQDESTKSVLESLDLCSVQEQETSSSPFKDEEQRKQDFLNNTLEISPIKVLSPVREKKTPSPETSSDFVVITLSSPVQSNGEPFEKCDSPEIFTEDKVSPDKRDQSPPREAVTPTSNASPKSLSLKKNKPQVRTGGRGAQMLGLCVSASDRMNTIKNAEKSVESEETKKCSPLNTTARRNLRILYNTTNESNETTSEENEENENFLKLKRSLPAADSSPAVPILKRKFDMIDDTTVSPASKRKRVSFHDPPVSTTICVKKYIEPCGVRSPQNSALKRQERQIRSQLSLNLKSQRRLDTAFKLDSALTKAVESFSNGEVPASSSEDTEVNSLDATPTVEVVKTSELNDSDPICVDLINCTDPIENIAGGLSSPSMKPLLVKEFAGKIESVGDLARMTELEVNRLCIKAPKVNVARKVLSEYAKTVNKEVPSKVNEEVKSVVEATLKESDVPETNPVDDEKVINEVETGSAETQTDCIDTSLMSTQTDSVPSENSYVQTDESGSKSTADIVTLLMEKSDFCERLNGQLDDASKKNIAESLPFNVIMDSVIQKMSSKDSSSVLDRILEQHTPDTVSGRSDNLGLSFIQDYLCDRFSTKDLMLFCSDLLKIIHDKKM